MEDLNKALQIGAVVMTALLIIKGIVDGEDTQVPNAVQEDFDWSDPNMGSLGDRVNDAFRVGTVGRKKD